MVHTNTRQCSDDSIKCHLLIVPTPTYSQA